MTLGWSSRLFHVLHLRIQAVFDVNQPAGGLIGGSHTRSAHYLPPTVLPFANIFNPFWQYNRPFLFKISRL